MNNSIQLKKSLGQNFLNDNTIVQNIVDITDIKDNSLIIEIGPGSGILTKKLVEFNCNVISIEIDKRLKQFLDKLIYPNLKIVYDDFLKIDIEHLIKNYSYSKLILIANVPYYITSPIIKKVIDSNLFDEITIMIQKEVGERLKANPCTSEYGSFTVYTQYFFNVENHFLVDKKYFNPIPKVDSMVINLKKNNRNDNINLNLFFDFVKECFKQKRKNLKNNLSKKYDAIKLEELLKKINKDFNARAEELTIDEFIYLFNNL